MLTFRRQRPDEAAADQPAWLAEDGCNEFQAVGLELQLIDAVERRDQVRRGGVGDLTALEAEIRHLQLALEEASAHPLGAHPVG